MIPNTNEKLIPLNKVIFNKNLFHKCKLHEICSYIAMYPPKLVNTLIRAYTKESDLCSPSWFASIDLIGKSLFYTYKGNNLPGFFTWDFGENCKQNDIQDIFCKKIYEIFCAFYEHICLSLKIRKKQFKEIDIKFITFFIENKDSYDIINRFIHNDMYTVNAYNNSPIEQIKDFLASHINFTAINQFIQIIYFW